MNTVHTEEYKGYTIQIIPDEDAQSPDTLGGDDSLFLITTRNRHFVVERGGFTLDGCRDGGYPEYEVFPLFAYIHSGVSLSLNRGGQFNCLWDSGQIGYVLAKKEDIPNAQKAAESLVVEWNDFLSGNVYGYVVTKDGVDIDSCWGFYGYPTKYVLTEAHSIVDFHVKG